MSTRESAPPGLAAEALLAELARRGFAEAEVYEKRGRSRGYERLLDRESTGIATECGWSARAGDARRSLFVAATGAPSPAVALPDASPHALLLPEEKAGEPWLEPDDLLVPLATENEASALIDGIERVLAAELSGARLVAVALSDGASEATIVSSRGVRVTTRARAAWLRIEAESSGRRLLFSAGEREARRFRPDAIARRLVDRFTALAALPAAGASEKEAPPSAFVLSAPLVARLVEAVAPLFLGRAADSHLASILDAGRRLAADAVTFVDDGRFDGAGAGGAGLLAAAVDGEGVATRAVTLVEAGRFVQPLCAWWEEDARAGVSSSGCSRRASWRDLPRRAPTHLYLAPGTASVNELLAEIAEGSFLIDAEGAVEIDAGTLSFSVPVSGFRLSGGRAVAPLGPRRLSGTVAGLLGGVRAVARDLSFVPGDGQFGAPTILADGLALSGAGSPPAPIR